MKNKEVLILLSMVLIISGCSLGNVDETPISSYAPKSTGVETGSAAGSIKEDAPEMEGKTFIKEYEDTEVKEDGSEYRTNNEESAVQASEKAEQPNMDLCVGLAKEIFDATNAEREATGVEPLMWSDELAGYANIRAEEIITNFSHTREDGTKCYALSDLIFGENIARGPHATGAEFLEHWMESKGHKENILNPQYTTIGIGTTCTEQGDTAVQLFGID